MFRGEMRAGPVAHFAKFESLTRSGTNASTSCSDVNRYGRGARTSWRKSVVSLCRVRHGHARIGSSAWGRARQAMSRKPDSDVVPGNPASGLRPSSGSPLETANNPTDSPEGGRLPSGSPFGGPAESPPPSGLLGQVKNTNETEKVDESRPTRGRLAADSLSMPPQTPPPTTAQKPSLRNDRSKT